MKFAWYTKAFTVAMLSVCLFACKDKDKAVSTTPAPVGGDNGTATMHIVLKHDGLYVDTGMVYIKYNAVVTPSDGKYDDSAVIKTYDGLPRATFYALKQGKYFFACTGWDIIRSKNVYGTRPYEISENGLHGDNYMTVETVAK